MKLSDNPFYILNLPCDAEMADIFAAGERMSRALDENTRSNAQSCLLDPKLRLIAELNWFIDLKLEETASIRDSIRFNSPIDTGNLVSLSKLNAMLYNFSLSRSHNPSELLNFITDIDREYAELDIMHLLDVLNGNRTAAKLTSVQEAAFSAELNRKRKDIGRVLLDSLAKLNQEQHIDLITQIVEKFIADAGYNNGVILSDVVDLYGLAMNVQIEDKTSQIEAQADAIYLLDDACTINSEILALIRMLREWHKLVHPLQLNAKASGMPHKTSERVRLKLRPLASALNDEKKLPCESKMLLSAMKEVFAEVEDPSQMLGFDAESFSEGEVLIEISAKMEDIKKYSEKVLRRPLKGTVHDFTAKVKELNKHIKETEKITSEMKMHLRTNLAILSLNTSVELYEGTKLANFSLIITKMLRKEFSDIPNIQNRIDGNSNKLRLSILSKKAGLIGIIIVVAIFIFCAVAGLKYCSSALREARYGGYTITLPSNFAMPSIYYPTMPSISFDFSDLDISNLSTPGTSPSSESLYTSSSEPYDSVYVKITSIEPLYGIYVEGSSDYTHFLCECETFEGDKVWLHITVSQYITNFDSFASSRIDDTSFGFIPVFPPATVHGTVTTAESIGNGFESITDSTVIEFDYRE
ncbi:MAG: hypothetical protein Q4C01_04940 [Clostridia bacterium]|nr:hypothetical protein [Clostridia bacterium]